MKSLSVFLLVFVAAVGRAQSFNDYSLLLPLPSAAEMPETLGAASRGARGVLLPPALIEALPTIVVGEDRESLFSERLKVVAVRLDPCFFEGTGPVKCRAQIRFVWQPLLMDRRVAMTQDAAVHTFHDLSDAEFEALMAELKPFASGVRGDALSVHPGLARYGYASAYWRGLRAVLLKYAGESNLSRGTFMSVNPMGTVWVFGAFDVVDGKPVRIMVPRVNFAVQGFFVDTRVLKDFRARMNPFPPNEAPLLTFLSDSAAARAEKTEDDLQKIVREAYEFENPSRHNPGTLDCVSCHIAQTVRLWGEFHFPQWKAETLFGDVRYRSELNLANTSPDPFRADSLRAFGYFGSNPVISGRVINETAAVLESRHPVR